MNTTRFATVTISRVQALKLTPHHRGSRTRSRLQHISSFVCAPPKTRFDVVMSTRISRVRDAISAPHRRILQTIPSAPATTRSLGPGSRNTQRATSPRSGIWVLGQIHSTSTFAFRPFFVVSTARGRFNVERAPTARGHAQVEISAVSFVSDLVPLLASVTCRGSGGNVFCFSLFLRPLDCEAVIRVGTLSFVQFVGLTVLAVRLEE